MYQFIAPQPAAASEMEPTALVPGTVTFPKAWHALQLPAPQRTASPPRMRDSITHNSPDCRLDYRGEQWLRQWYFLDSADQILEGWELRALTAELWGAHRGSARPRQGLQNRRYVAIAWVFLTIRGKRARGPSAVPACTKRPPEIPACSPPRLERGTPEAYADR